MGSFDPKASLRLPHFTEIPEGLLSVAIGDSTLSAPVAGVTEYCETVAPSKFDTNIQLSSPRIAIDVGRAPVATVGGLSAVKLPVVGLILNAETVFEEVPTTYTLFPKGSTTRGPGALALPERENGEPLTATRLPSAFGQGPGEIISTQIW